MNDKLQEIHLSKQKTKLNVCKDLQFCILHLLTLMDKDRH